MKQFEKLIAKGLYILLPTTYNNDPNYAEYCKELDSFIENEDNPVPSLNNTELKALALVNDLMDDIKDPYFQTIEYIEVSLEKIKKVLENGRTTDKEQPNLKVILDFCKTHNLKCVEEYDRSTSSEVLKITLRSDIG